MTQPLIVVLPTHLGDADNAEVLLRWIAELGSVSQHSLLLAADSELPQERVKAMLNLVRADFHSVRAMLVNVGVKGWPLAANLTFRAVCRQVQEFYRLDFLLLEPDAVPLRSSWIDDIADAYHHSPRPFMGAVLDAEKAIEGLPARYMSAIAVWPQDTYGRLEALWKDARFTGPTKPPKLATAHWQSGVRAFDMIGAEYLVPRAHHTPLIQHFWGTDYNTPPLFVPTRTEADPTNAVTLDLIRKDAVIFHRIKNVSEFLALWRIRMEHKEALAIVAENPVLSELPTEAPKNPLPFVPAAEKNPNWRGGEETLKERRQAAAQKSKEYLENSRRKAQDQASNQTQPAAV